MTVGIVGCGHVGRAMKELIPQAFLYDPGLGLGSIDEINNCDFAFVCVPTPAREDGSCDISAVEEVVSWLEASVIILRSTVPVGTTDMLREKYQKHIIFQPEYYGETPRHPYADLRKRRWITLGGDDADCRRVISLYTVCYEKTPEFYLVSAREAELAKYMSNAFLAMKVVFTNAMYDYAQSTGADFDAARAAWLADPRIGKSHTKVFPDDRGYGGSCFPKDVEALRYSMREAGLTTDLFDGMIEHNRYFRSLNEKEG